MSDGEREIPPPDWSTEWWWWFTAALFLLIPADLFTTLLAVSRHGLAVEANPIVRWLLSRGLLYVTVANLGATVVVVCAFRALLFVVRRTSAPHEHDTYFERVVTVWLRLLVVVGVLVVGNNLLVVFSGTTLH